MPTGYTAGILDGEIKTFPEFAKLCMRAFGAAIHMRDDSLKDEYVPRTPTNYHVEQIAKAKKEIELVMGMTDEEIVEFKKGQLLESQKHQNECIEKTRSNAEMLTAFLRYAEDYKSPTEEHTGIKEFMIQQLKETLKWDGSFKYHFERLGEIETELANLNALSIRAEMAAAAKKDLEYHTEENRKEIERCAASNKWVEDFLASL